MSKVLVDRKALEEAAEWLEMHSSSSGSAEWFAAGELRDILAQPAEAEGVEVVAWANPADLLEIKKPGRLIARYVTGSRSGAADVPLVRQSDHLAALSAVTAERDRLLEAAGKAIAWFDAEQNESGVGINRRIKLCRDAENSLRAAMADQGGDL
ncbi:hypothetical protein [Pseudomonas songnenensis]|uniref:Uncharacterized protein n=1 Tax=Pseudomonas songnenensis TaxID=1176259 RepID=A0A482U7P0_9PSED|nr:hypothetical protein [Pseudomonas songnenensis]RYJ63209.1 hypothetical protein EJA06_004425 [Pseudomonas songnenensis]